MRKCSNTCKDCQPSVAGDANPNWRGGVVHHSSGYLMVRVPERGYVFQHVLMMEQAVKRRLFDGENVHHKNGVKDDNRLSNLELWSRPQPSGARALDLLQWARTIVERYEPIEDLLATSGTTHSSPVV